MVGRHLGNETIEFSYAVYGFSIDPQDDVVLTQACLLGRTVLDHLGHSDAAYLINVITAHVFAVNVFRVNAKKATIDEE